MHEPMKRRMQGERGASLAIALAFLAVFGLLTAVLLGFGDTSIRASEAYRNKRTVNYGSDGALDAAINRVRLGDSENTPMGRDPNAYTTDACNPTSTQPVISIPATGSTRAMVVSCATAAGSGSGLHADLGAAPENALLTLGDRKAAGSTSSLGVRNAESGPYNGTGYRGFYHCRRNANSDPAEYGIRFDNTRVCDANFQDPLVQSTINSWNVRGNIFSNSRIVVSDPGGWPSIINPPSGDPGTISARGGCSGFTCTPVGWDFGDGLGQDPNYTPYRQPAPNRVPTLANGSPLPVQLPASGNNAWVASKIGQCTPSASNGIGLVKFDPGIYRDASAFNQLFGDPACENATFWFQPGSYYFDFTNTFPTDASDINGYYYCANYNGRYGISRDDLTHQWCIGGRGPDYGGQRVIGGTPYGWDPDQTLTSREIVSEPHSAGTASTWWWRRTSPFTNQQNAIYPNGFSDNSTADLIMTSGRSGGSIWVSDFRPQTPRGGVDGVDLEIKHGAQYDANHRINNPTVTVYFNNRYGHHHSSNRCGPYTLPKPPSSPSALTTVSLSSITMTDGTNAATDLSACLNSGDRINSAVVQYNVSRPGNDGSSTLPVAKLGGLRLHVTAHDGPSFPRPPSATDAGGDCDQTAPGVQFIFGGDSHMYVPNGGMELCAGPNPDASQGGAAHGMQIALYQPPTTPRLQPTTVFGTNANDGVDNQPGALSIAEGSGISAANIKYHYVCPTSFCNDFYEGSMTLRFPGYAPPANYSIAKVELRASYNNANTDSSTRENPQYELSGLVGSCGAKQDADSGTGMRTMTRDVTSCLTAGNRIGSALNVVWHARRQCSNGLCPASAGTTIDQLDGIELVVTLSPTDPDTILRPPSGCMVASPNYWEGTGNPDCALLKVEGAFTAQYSYHDRRNRLLRSRGRVSIKGTAYAPSAAFDIDDTDVYYPLFSRGLIARHVRFKTFKYHQDVNAAGQCLIGDGLFCYSEPVFNNWLDPTQSDRQVAFYVCEKSTGPCTATDRTLQGRAVVTYAAKTNVPKVASFAIKHP